MAKAAVTLELMVARPEVYLCPTLELRVARPKLYPPMTQAAVTLELRVARPKVYPPWPRPR